MMPQNSSQTSTDLPEPYQQERGRYALSSGLLFGWEAFRVQFSGISIAGLEVSLVQDGVIAYVLLALTIYFAFRTSIEWALFKGKTQVSSPAFLDFWVSHSLGTVAVTLFSVRRFSTWQPAIGLRVPLILAYISAFTLAFMAWVVFVDGYRFFLREPIILLATVVCAVTAGIIVVDNRDVLDVAAIGLGALLGIVMGRVKFHSPSRGPEGTQGDQQARGAKL
jgi:hypothetical protein